MTSTEILSESYQEEEASVSEEEEETPDGVAVVETVVTARRRRRGQSWSSNSPLSQPLPPQESSREFRNAIFYVMSVLLLSLQLLVLLTGSVCVAPVLFHSALTPHCSSPLNYWVALLCMALHWLLVSTTCLWWCLVRRTLNSKDSQQGFSFTEQDFYLDD